MPDRPIVYRAMTDGDVSAAMLIRKAALDWLNRTEGHPVSAWNPASAHADTLRHLLRTDPGGSVVAESHGVVVGFAQAHVRGDIWFLAQLFVVPDVHSLGVGGQLLRRARKYGSTSGARVYSVVSSTSPVAQALYMRSGMFGAALGYRMAGPLEPLLQLPEPDANKKRIVDCSGWQDRIADLDRFAYGAERRQDHEWYLSLNASDDAHGSFALTRDGEFLGYAYAGANDGSIAPLAAYEPEDQLPLVRMAAEWQLDHEVTTGAMFVLSLNDTLMSALLAAGWRINSWTFFLRSEPFGHFDRYHPAGGILL